MQKKIIALAVAGLVSGSAFAQSNVTISGNVEAHFEMVSAKGATAAGADSKSRNRVTDNTSALRLSGTEALGNGLSAFWQVESDMGLDNNAAGTAGATGFGNRNSGVGLRGDFGTVLMGHWDAHYQAQLEGGVDFGSSGALPHSANSMNLTSQVQGVGLIGNRLNNVVAYITPNMSGLTARIAYAASGTDAVENTTADVGGKNAGWHLFVNYGNGPINAFYSYLKVNNAGAQGTNAAGTFTLANNRVVATNPNAVAMGNDVKANKLGFAYTMGAVKLGLVWDKTEVDSAAGAGLVAKRTAWSLPVSYTMGNNAFYFAYAKAGKVDNAAGQVADSGAKNYILGYTYAMSKRTSLGVSYSQIKNQAAANYDFWSRGVGGVAAGADPKSFSMGINHTF